MTRHVIIGTGVAAISAAISIRSFDSLAEIVVVGDENDGYYSRPGLAYFLTGEVDESTLFPFKSEDYKRINLRHLRFKVTQILPSEKQILLSDGHFLTYDKLLLAVGSSAVPLPIPGGKVDGVFKLDNLRDARQIIQAAKGAKAAVIIGGGITALELAEGLRARGLKVHYIMRGDRYWSGVLDTAESRMVEKLLIREGVNLRHNLEIKQVQTRAGKLASVRLSNDELINVDIMAYAIGVIPRLELVKSSGILHDRGVLVDEEMRTNKREIFAAGDVAQVLDPVSGKFLLSSLWSSAREQGKIAGANMAGNPAKYTPPPAFNVTRLAGLTVTIIGAVQTGADDPQKGFDEDLDLVGIARGDSETWRYIPDVHVAQGDFEVNHLRLMLTSERIVGAVIMGNQKLSGPLRAMITNKVDISSISKALLTPKAPVADIIAKFWHEHQNNTPLITSPL